MSVTFFTPTPGHALVHARARSFQGAVWSQRSLGPWVMFVPSGLQSLEEIHFSSFCSSACCLLDTKISRADAASAADCFEKEGRFIDVWRTIEPGEGEMPLSGS